MVGDVCQHLTVHLHTRDLEPVDEAAVGQAVLARRRVNPRDPQGPKLALTLAPVPIRILSGLYDRLLGDTIFANQYAAYEALSDGMKATLGTMRAVHSSRHAFGVPAAAYGSDQSYNNPEAATQDAVHPVVIRHRVFAVSGVLP